MRRVPGWIIAIGIAVVVLACFSPTLGHDWIDNWDDDKNLIYNAAYRRLDS